MAEFSLCAFENSPYSIKGNFEKKGSHGEILYEVMGPLDDLVLEPLTNHDREDFLWKRTCFELFVGLDSPKYLEFNFSPSGAWAAYRFSDYRKNDGNYPLVSPPLISHEKKNGVLSFQSHFQLPENALSFGIAAILLQGDHYHYFSLCHPSPKNPDFHLRQSFTIF